MLDNHTTPPDLKGKTIAAMYEERKANKPDPWTVAWLKSRFEEVTKGYLGACHAINTAIMLFRGTQERPVVLA